MATILIVDDEAQLRRVVRLMLAMSGYEVIEAATGKEALKSIKEKEIDLVITDIFMPDMDGLELIKEIKKISSELKVLVVSGNGQNDSDLYLDLASRFGADRTMRKPFQNKDLVETTAALVNKQKPSFSVS
jgi:CheY-like chemotaxis protein